MEENKKTTTKEIDNFEDSKFKHFLKYNEKREDGSQYCLILPCHTKENARICYELFRDAQGGNWSGDIMKISAEDYKKLIKKSRNLEIIESL